MVIHHCSGSVAENMGLPGQSSLDRLSCIQNFVPNLFCVTFGMVTLHHTWLPGSHYECQDTYFLARHYKKVFIVWYFISIISNYFWWGIYGHPMAILNVGILLNTHFYIPISSCSLFTSEGTILISLCHLWHDDQPQGCCQDWGQWPPFNGQTYIGLF